MKIENNIENGNDYVWGYHRQDTVDIALLHLAQTVSETKLFPNITKEENAIILWQHLPVCDIVSSSVKYLLCY